MGIEPVPVVERRKSFATGIGNSAAFEVAEIAVDSLADRKMTFLASAQSHIVVPAHKRMLQDLVGLLQLAQMDRMLVVVLLRAALGGNGLSHLLATTI